MILDTIEADGPDADEERRLIASLLHPVLVTHGTDDQVIPFARSEEPARLAGGTLAVIEGFGDEPQLPPCTRGQPIA